jgi:hypothetical protein
LAYLAVDLAVPVFRRTEAEVETWWARVFAERGIEDPAPSLETAYAAMRADASPTNCAAYTRAAIAAGLEYYGDDGTDLGAGGWRQWCGICDGADEIAPVDDDPSDLAPAIESGQWRDGDPMEAPPAPD